MNKREDTIRKWFSLWLNRQEADLRDFFSEDAT